MTRDGEVEQLWSVVLRRKKALNPSKRAHQFGEFRLGIAATPTAIDGTVQGCAFRVET